MPVQQVFPVAHYPPEGELFEPMLSAAGVTIERILSAPGSASEPYDQATDEWVLLLQGEARLEVADVAGWPGRALACAYSAPGIGHLGRAAMSLVGGALGQASVMLSEKINS